MEGAGLPRRAEAGRGSRHRPTGSVVALVLAAVALVVLPGSAYLPRGHPGVGAPAGPTPRGPSPALRADARACGAAGDPCATASPVAPGGDGLGWTNLTAPFGPAPSERAFAAMAYDSATSRVVLFGGESPYGTPLEDLWQSSDGSWSPWFVPNGAAPSPRWGASLVDDPVDGYLVLFGGRNATGFLADTWTLNATGWHRLPAAVGPSARAFAQAAFDAGDGSVVLFGGGSASDGGRWAVANDTWTFHAGSWTNRTAWASGAAPPARMMGSAASDPAEGGVVLFGGTSGGPSGAPSGETWQYLGGGWSNLTGRAGPGPSPRDAAAMAFDARLGGVLLFGGSAAGGGAPNGETWAFEQGTWQNLTGPRGSHPAPRAGAGMAYDAGAGRAILFGGDVPATYTYFGDTWGYGLSPLEAVLYASPTAGVAPLNVTFDVNVTGGATPYALHWTFGDGGIALNVTSVVHSYAWVGNFSASVTVGDGAGTVVVRTTLVQVLTSYQNTHQWASVGGNHAAPSPRTSTQMGYDPDFHAVILFGGYSPSNVALADTWEFVNNVWINLTSNLTAAPPARWGGALAYDPPSHELLLFGGRGVDGFFNDTWAFTAAGWRPLAPVTSPSPRGFFAMTFDAGDGYLLLQGGGIGNIFGSPWTVLDDTWEYRGSTWVNVTASVTGRPPPLLGAAGAYDPAVGAVVLFGGSSVAPGGTPGTCYPSGATWLFQGGTWSASTTAHTPTASLLAVAAYDANDLGVVLFGGAQDLSGLCYSTRDTYMLAGGDWSSLAGSLVTVPPARDAAAAAYDATEGVVVVFGGTSNGLFLGDTWVYPAPLNGSLGSTVGNPNGTFGNGGSGGGGPSGNGTGGSGNPNGTGPSAPFVVGYSVSATRSPGPFSVAFAATATGGSAPFNFTWDFGDSSPPVAGANVQHRYTFVGSYDPVLTATDTAGDRVVDVLPMIVVLPGNANGTALAPLTGGVTGAAISAALTVLVAGAAAVAGVVYAWDRRQRRLEEEGAQLVRDIEESKNPEGLPPRAR